MYRPPSLQFSKKIVSVEGISLVNVVKGARKWQNWLIYFLTNLSTDEDERMNPIAMFYWSVLQADPINANAVGNYS